MKCCYVCTTLNLDYYSEYINTRLLRNLGCGIPIVSAVAMVPRNCSLHYSIILHVLVVTTCVPLVLVGVQLTGWLGYSLVLYAPQFGGWELGTAC